VLPLTALGAPEDVVVLGEGVLLGRDAVQVEVPFERAASLFPFLSLGVGDWRPFFPTDRVRIWLDRTSWFPLGWEVLPAPGHARDAWALRFGLPPEAARRPVFSAQATSVDLSAPPAASTFAVPSTGGAEDGGAREVMLSDVEREAGFEPLAPPELGGLDLYRVVIPGEATREALVTYADGLSFLKLGETRTWSSQAPFGPVDVRAEEIVLSDGGLAYYEPATPELGRRLSIHAAGTDLYLETNLPRGRLFEVAASLPVTGLGMPEDWRIRRTAGATVERVSLGEASSALGFEVELPETLPAGFTFASVELVRVGDHAGVTVYFRDAELDTGGGLIRLHLEAATELPPASASRQSAVEVSGAEGRWVPARSQLEWVADGAYRSLDAPGFGLEQLLAIAASIPAPNPASPEEA
jgi:hypothetical protein